MSAVGRAFADIRQRFPDVHTAVVAYSGGRDSHVLLHAAKQHLRLPLRALHVAHGLQSAAEHWPQHCADTCVVLDIPLDIIEAQVSPNGAGLESAARDARYEAFEAQLRPGELLLQAHHAQDQAETLMLRLLRGSGLRGMGGIPEHRCLGRAKVWRPLLNIDSQCLADYALEHQLEWIEDPSNTDERFDRNYLRHRVMPLLSQRWPSTAKQFSAAARRATEAEAILEEFIAPALARIVDSDGSLCCDGLLAQSPSQQIYLLRAWLMRSAEQAPSEAQLRAALHEVVCARRDADPRLRLGSAELRRHRERLYWVEIDGEKPPAEMPWVELSCPLLFGDQRLSMNSKFAQRLSIPDDAMLMVRTRQGGERLRLRSGERPLKKIMQDLSLPSWRRDSTPLLYVNGEFAAIWNYSIAAKYEKTD